MALINCKSCGHQMSEHAEKCQKCGAKIEGNAGIELEESEKKTKIKGINANKKRINKVNIILLLLLLIAGVVIALLLSRLNKQSEGTSSEVASESWEDIILKSKLPQPISSDIELTFNYADHLSVDVKSTSYFEYEEYLNECINEGYVYIVESGASAYEAFNEDAYKLKLNYSESNEEMDISLIPCVEGKIQWSNGDLARLLPIPNSDMGSIAREYIRGYEVYIGNITIEEYEEYIKNCKENGFEYDIQEQTTQFYAENTKGYELEVEYYECDLMHINLEVPEEVADEEENDYSADISNSSSSASKSNAHTCEECSSEGTHSIIGISGSTEYYCTTHYNEMKDMMDSMGF